MSDAPTLNLAADDLSRFNPQRPAFVTFGEVMVREPPADMERPERSRLVRLSMAGSEYSVAIGLSRLGVPASFITRVPDNPHGHALRNIAREQGVHTGHIVWAPPTEPVGRYIYELGRTPRPGIGIYQRMFSAASRLDAGMVDWAAALDSAQLFHVTGISFGLADHSGYPRNPNLHAFREAIAHKPDGCLVGFDFNYRSTLWTEEAAQAVLTPILTDHVDILITSLEDMARFYGIGCGRYSPAQVLGGEVAELRDDDLRALAQQVHARFGTKILAITRRYADSIEQQRWESAAMDSDGNVRRSAAIRPMTILDVLGGGDAWLAGFYYGLFTAGFNADGMAKGIAVGDAATRLKQTLMFDLPIIDRADIQRLLDADAAGGGTCTIR
ncbi:MAG: sugar kinase [Anaerolineae bacterium]